MARYHQLKAFSTEPDRIHIRSDEPVARQGRAEATTLKDLLRNNSPILVVGAIVGSLWTYAYFASNNKEQPQPVTRQSVVRHSDGN